MSSQLKRKKYTSLTRTKFCLQQRKTSVLLDYIEILQHFSLQILTLYFMTKRSTSSAGMPLSRKRVYVFIKI